MRVNERLGFEMEVELEEEENAEIEEIEAIYEVPEEQTDDNLEIYNETETNSTREKRETSSELLTFDDVVLIFDMCRYEKAWNPTEISPWCAAFKEEDLKVCMKFVFRIWKCYIIVFYIIIINILLIKIGIRIL